MAKVNYNTFVVQSCKHGKILLVTSSARKAKQMFEKGNCVEVWNMNQRVERITIKTRERNPLGPYIGAEREHIRQRQERKRKWWSHDTARMEKANY